MALNIPVVDSDLPELSDVFPPKWPTGLTLSSSGLASWVPTPSQIPSTNVVVYSVTDGVSATVRHQSISRW